MSSENVACNNRTNHIEEHDLAHQKKVQHRHRIYAVRFLGIEVNCLRKGKHKYIKYENREYTTCVATEFFNPEQRTSLPDKVDTI